jgi:hypothetical protein
MRIQNIFNKFKLLEDFVEFAFLYLEGLNVVGVLFQHFQNVVVQVVSERQPVFFHLLLIFLS